MKKVKGQAISSNDARECVSHWCHSKRTHTDYNAGLSYQNVHNIHMLCIVHVVISQTGIELATNQNIQLASFICCYLIFNHSHIIDVNHSLRMYVPDFFHLISHKLIFGWFSFLFITIVDTPFREEIVSPFLLDCLEEVFDYPGKTF